SARLRQPDQHPGCRRFRFQRGSPRPLSLPSQRKYPTASYYSRYRRVGERQELADESAPGGSWTLWIPAGLVQRLASSKGRKSSSVAAGDCASPCDPTVVAARVGNLPVQATEDPLDKILIRHEDITAYFRFFAWLSPGSPRSNEHVLECHGKHSGFNGRPHEVGQGGIANYHRRQECGRAHSLDWLTPQLRRPPERALERVERVRSQSRQPPREGFDERQGQRSRKPDRFPLSLRRRVPGHHGGSQSPDPADPDRRSRPLQGGDGAGSAGIGQLP